MNHIFYERVFCIKKAPFTSCSRETCTHPVSDSSCDPEQSFTAETHNNLLFILTYLRFNFHQTGFLHASLLLLLNGQTIGTYPVFDLTHVELIVNCIFDQLWQQKKRRKEMHSIGATSKALFHSLQHLYGNRS